ncbi:uncharacterized protein LOC128857695 [Anastrepha ludens]|uniref:uncharacterized protein LOC128857695 n=1 Tax=Anastrepha ludens TaxID=28586 RepID=UPI0023B19B20|nr:uncharacterized protein LOC128857695 [Anastrepha ludens]
MDRIIKSVAANPNVIKGVKCGRTNTKETVTNVLHKNFVEKISDCLRNNKFSLIIDEATDVSSAKCLALVVRYFDKENGKIRDHFLSLIELDKSDSKTIFESIKAFFERFKIPLTNLIGFAADNASVMMGQINGVQRLLKDINPHLYVIGCICHSMHLCSSKAAKAIPSKIENLVRDIYLFFNYSSKRQKEFVEFQNYFNLENHKILKVSNTRWLSMENAVYRVLEQWKALVHYFHLTNFEKNHDMTNDILTNMNDKMMNI